MSRRTTVRARRRGGVAVLALGWTVGLAGCVGLPGGEQLAAPSSVRVTTGPTASQSQTSEPAAPAAPDPLPTSASPSTAPRTITIGWAGDTIPASTRHGLPRRPGDLLGPVTPALSAPDLMLVNLEGTLGSRGLSKCVRWNVADCHAFQAPSSYARTVFAAAGIDAVNTANNHSFDFGPEGQADTREALAAEGIAAAGAEDEVTVVDVEGVKVGLIGVAPYGWGADFRDASTVRALVRRAVASSDVVVVMVHSGAEGSDRMHTPNRVEWHLGENRGNSRAIAHEAIDEGADLVVMSGPHVVRGMEFYEGRLIAYSLGNLVGYGGAFQVAGDLALSGVLHVEVRSDGSYASGRLVPLRIGRDGIPRPDSSATTTKRIRALSVADFGAAAARIAVDGTITAPVVARHD